MAESLKENCPICAGVGVVPHERRKMENGVPDPTYFRLLALCAKCGGSGKVATNLKAIEERKPGNIADNIGK